MDDGGGVIGGDRSYSSLLYWPVFATPAGQTVMRGPSAQRT